MRTQRDHKVRPVTSPDAWFVNYEDPSMCTIGHKVTPAELGNTFDFLGPKGTVFGYHLTDFASNNS